MVVKESLVQDIISSGSRRGGRLDYCFPEDSRGLNECTSPLLTKD